MRLIDADEVLKRWGLKFYAMGGDRLGPNGDEISFYVNGLLNEIQNAPTVEYPEQIIIKCDTEEDKQKLLSALRNARLKVLVEEEERPTGEWIDKDDVEEEVYCSECGHAEKKDKFIWSDVNYCYFCGADMRGEDEEEQEEYE